MTDLNKKELIRFAKILVVVIVSLIALITNVEIWNVAAAGNTDGFHVVVSILNFLMEGVAIFFGTKKWLGKTEER